MTPERMSKIHAVAMARQFDLTVILENVHDMHNIGAVLRSCDSVGIREIFVLYSKPQVMRDRLKMGKRTSAGSRKWVKVHYYTDVEACFRDVRKKYKTVCGTNICEGAKSLYELELSKSVALLFGNENEGLTEATLKHVDINFMVPQVGMVQSLNISVACAVSVYEAYRQRLERGFYTDNTTTNEEELNHLFDEYVEVHQSQRKGKSVPKIESPES